LNSRFILRKKGSGSLDILMQVLYEQGLTRDAFHKIIEVGNIHAIKQLVHNDMGISFLYKAAVDKELASGTLHQINIKNFDITREFNFVYPKNSIHESQYLSWFDNFKSISASIE